MNMTSRKTDARTSQAPAPATPPGTLAGHGEALLVDVTRTYALDPGAALRASPCLICRTALGAGQISFHVYITLEECSDGDGHIVAAAFARHVRCIPRNDRTLMHAVQRVLSHPRTA